ncbi:MAG: PxKF domain-containing protein [Caldilineaceae bacterium]|nr:PxKF domain-containing protein [Caldilineaceae bacterium]
MSKARSFRYSAVVLLVSIMALALALPAFADDDSGSSSTLFIPIASSGEGQVHIADNVQNDVTAGGNDTFTAGGSTTVNYRITANSGDGEGGCNATVVSPATVTINVPVGVTASPSSLNFTSCSTNQSVTFSSNTPGNYGITVSVSDPGIGTYNTNPAALTLHVLAPLDSTPPVITPNIAGTLGNNGWYVSDVTVSWSVVDNESAVSSSSGCDPTTINADTAGASLTCTATSAGGTASNSVSIKRDATAPTISGSASPAANGAGWNNTDVNVSFTCGDNLSGVASCGPNQTLSSEGAGQSATGTAIDNAGNSASVSVSGINIDKTAPSVSLVGGPANGGNYYFGSVPAAPTCSASDDTSGIAGACAVSGYNNVVGSHTVTASATDNAGNSNSASASYTVLAWTLKGFYQPVDMNGVVNTVKNGSTVPLKFEIFAGSTELTETSRVASLGVKEVSCSALSSATDDIELTATGGTSLRYDTTAGQFIYNWKTPAGAGKCYRVTMTTQENSLLEAFFKLK